MSSESQPQPAGNRRNQVMVGELPGDFLRMGTSAQQQQCMQDERVAQILQAQQQAGYMLPANLAGKLGISVVQAKLAKNYGITKMDPYCRIRIGHAVFETPTAYNGAKNPRWNKEVQCFLPKGVNSIYVEIFDERSFTEDNRVAWAHVTIPEACMNGDTVDEWYPLSGNQGDGKEGMINFILTLSPVEATPFVQAPVWPQAQVVYPYAVPGTTPIYAGGPPVAQQSQIQRQPGYTEEDFKQVKEMFPDMDDDVIRSVFAANSGNKDSTINSLLSMSAD